LSSWKESVTVASVVPGFCTSTHVSKLPPPDVFPVYHSARYQVFPGVVVPIESWPPDFPL
jgi:hypothetical protein